MCLHSCALDKKKGLLDDNLFCYIINFYHVKRKYTRFFLYLAKNAHFVKCDKIKRSGKGKLATSLHHFFIMTIKYDYDVQR